MRGALLLAALWVPAFCAQAETAHVPAAELSLRTQVTEASASDGAVESAEDDSGGVREVQAASSWALKWPDDEVALVPFKGRASFDGAGRGSGSVSYPAVDVPTLVAAVIVHGIFNEVSKKAQKDQIQEAADRVLANYQSVLATLRYADLAREVEEAATQEHSGAPTWLVEMSPTYYLTQDESALLLDSKVRVRRMALNVAHAPDSAAAYDGAIRVISAPIASAEPAAFWLADDGRQFRRVTAELMRHAVELALGMADGSQLQPAGPARTFRYPEGGRERFERATLIEERCDRVILLTLRETLLSIPAQGSGQASGSCPAQGFEPEDEEVVREGEAAQA